MAIDLSNGKLFDYTSGFRFTSRALTGPDTNPLSVTRVAVMLDHSSTAGGELTYDCKLSEQAFSSVKKIQLPYNDDQFSRIEFNLETEDIATCRKWQLRLKSLSGNVRIKEIQVWTQTSEAQDYSL